MLALFENAAGELLLSAGFLWIVYLAIEPAIRSRYPHALITWNRLLAGRVLDPQVCSHILIGGAVGCVLWMGGSLIEFMSAAGVQSGGNVWVILGTRQFIARNALMGATSLSYGLLVFAMLCFLRLLVRYDILAALVTGVVFSMTEDAVTRGGNWQVMALMYIAIYGALAFVLIRFGLVASISTIFFGNGFANLWLGSDWKAWFAPTGVATLLLLLGIALVAFWKSLGSRDLFGGEQGEYAAQRR